MIILTLRTDKPEAEIGLFQDQQQLAYVIWQAHRQLAETLHKQISDMLTTADYSLKDINAIAVYKGPGSFTGLRIGISVANSLASSYSLPIVAQDGTNWQANSIGRLIEGETDEVALPEYGAAVHITTPKK